MKISTVLSLVILSNRLIIESKANKRGATLIFKKVLTFSKNYDIIKLSKGKEV